MGELFSGVLLLKAAQGGGRGRRKRWARTVGGNSGPWADKAAATAVQTCSVRPGLLCSDRGTDRWAPTWF
jgi:hypothetical protein